MAHTSDWAQQDEKEDGSTWENQDESTWGSETETNDGDGEVRGFAGEPSEELKIFVGNLPFDVDSEKLAALFEQTPGTVEVAEVSFEFFVLIEIICRLCSCVLLMLCYG